MHEKPLQYKDLQTTVNTNLTNKNFYGILYYSTMNTQREEFIGRLREELFQLKKKGKLTTEKKLAGLLRSSRTPVRESLRQLEAEGIIERRKNGISLRKPTLKEIVEAYDTRIILEGFAVRMAAEKAGESDLERLQKIVLKYSGAVESNNLDVQNEMDLLFHREIVKLSENSFILKIITLFSLLERAFRINDIITSSSGKDENPYPHETILEALKDGDPGECEKRMKLHIQWSKQCLIEETLNTKINHFNQK